MSSPFESTELTERADPTEAGGAVSIACASCRLLVAADAPCPSCGHQPASPAPAHASAAADLTLVLPPVPGSTAELEIPRVDHALQQAPSEAWPPLAAQPTPVYPRPSAPQPGAPSSLLRRASGRRGAGVLACAAALALVGAAAVAGLRNGRGSDDGPSTAPGGGVAASDLVPVSRAAVRVTASSTQHPDGSVSYAAANTLDGRPETAWNSDGQGAGAALTYSFTRAVDLRSITVLNGYQKVRAGRAGSLVDLYLLNERVKTVKVVTDAGSVTWTLRDDRAPQTLGHAFGATRTVRLEVASVYPSQRYTDLAVSDVTFGAASR